MVDPISNHVSTPFFPTRLEILAPSWAIFGVHAHLISFLALEKIVVLDRTYEILTSPFASVVIVFVSWTILLPIED
jgi:hypothetical protein